MLVLPQITDRAETYSSHLQRLMREQSLRATPQRNQGEVTPQGSPWERLECSAHTTLGSKPKLLPSDCGMDTSEMAVTQPSKALSIKLLTQLPAALGQLSQPVSSTAGAVSMQVPLAVQAGSLPGAEGRCSNSPNEETKAE